MLTIKNLAAEKELDRVEMGAVKGGTSLFSNAAFNGNLKSGVFFASPQINVAPVTQVDASQHTSVDLTNVTKTVGSLGSALGGLKL